MARNDCRLTFSFVIIICAARPPPADDRRLVGSRLEAVAIVLLDFWEAIRAKSGRGGEGADRVDISIARLTMFLIKSKSRSDTRKTSGWTLTSIFVKARPLSDLLSSERAMSKLSRNRIVSFGLSIWHLEHIGIRSKFYDTIEVPTRRQKMNLPCTRTFLFL